MDADLHSAVRSGPEGGPDPHLPPRQWTVLILRDVLDWPDADAAALLDYSVPALRAEQRRARYHLDDDGAGVLDVAGPGEEIDMHRVAALLHEHAPLPLAG